MKLPFESQSPSASEEEIEALEEAVGITLPPIYKALLTYSNGGEWPLDISPFTFYMFDVDTVIGNLTGTDFTEAFPDCLPIGGDGMSEYIALAFTSEDDEVEEDPLVVAIDAMADNAKDALYPVAKSLSEFVRHIGKEYEEND